jgi:FMN phosphatase YigB (HAD superfamily)
MIAALRAVAFVASTCSLALAASDARALCPSAVFFDLGNTLVDQSVAAPYPLFATARPTVEVLRERGVPVGIITNVPAGWDRDDLEGLIAEPAFLDEFDVLLLSSQAPAAKPNPAIYTHAHGLLAAPRPPIGATAFVGETLAEIANSATPTTGARAAGMLGIHLSTAMPSAFADATIASLDGLVELIDAGCPLFQDGFE